MPKKRKTSFTTPLVAALIVIAAVVGYYFLTNTLKKPVLPYEITEENGVLTVNPGGALVPDGPPNIAPPLTPPPAQ